MTVYRLDAGNYEHEFDGLTLHLNEAHPDPEMLRRAVAAIRALALSIDEVYWVGVHASSAGDSCIEVTYSDPTVRDGRRRSWVPWPIPDADDEVQPWPPK